MRRAPAERAARRSAVRPRCEPGAARSLVPIGPPPGRSRRRRCGLDGVGLGVAGADLDLAGLGLLGDGDGEREDTVVVTGLDVVGVEALAEEQLSGEPTVGPFRHDDVLALVTLRVPLGG